MRKRIVAACLAAGLGMFAGGCGSKSPSPIGPTAVTPGTENVVSGATVRGTVQTLGSASSATVQPAANANVSVVGTAIQAKADAAGRFELGGVPAGRAKFRFEAPAVKAELEIEGLESGRTLTIEVHISSDRALLSGTDDSRHETSLRGALESIDGSRLRVQGRVIQTDGLTLFLGRHNESIRPDALRVGSLVEVEGASQTDGSVYARKVKLEDGADDDPPGGEDDVEFRGVIESLNPFRVAGRLVTITSATRILGRQNAAIPFSDLAVGNHVEVEGASQGNGSVMAHKVKLEDDDDEDDGDDDEDGDQDDDDDDDEEVRVTGRVESMNPLRVAGRLVGVDSATRILDGRNNSVSLSSLAVGLSVQVEGYNKPDGSLLAKKIKIED